jgi:hypothetical protein
MLSRGSSSSSKEPEAEAEEASHRQAVSCLCVNASRERFRVDRSQGEIIIVDYKVCVSID